MRSFSAVKNEVERAGCIIDEGLGVFLPVVKRLYRGIIWYSLLGKITGRPRRALPTPIGLDTTMQVIMSSNDPYIHIDFVRSIVSDFNIERVHTLQYGHFPYSASEDVIAQIQSHIRSLETSIGWMPPSG
jgi:predicted alpha/beta hydrolase family esterase